MRGLYYACTYLSLLSYGNIVWENTYTTRQEPKRRLQKKLRYKDHYFFKLKKKHTGPIFKQLSILP